MIKWIITNRFASATITSNSENASFPDDNAVDERLRKVWRTTGVTSEWIKFDLGSAQTIDFFSLFNNNFTTGATVRIFAHPSDLGNTIASWAGVADLELTVTFNNRVGAIFPSTNNNRQWWFLGLEDAGNTDGFLSLGLVYGNQATVTTDNFNENWGETETDPSRITFSEGQTPYIVDKLSNQYKEFNIEFTDLDTADRAVLRTLLSDTAISNPFVIALDSTLEPLEWTRYGIITNPLDFTYTPNQRINTSLNFREAR